jgi:hypothetical protein
MVIKNRARRRQKIRERSVTFGVLLGDTSIDPQRVQNFRNLFLI